MDSFNLKKQTKNSPYVPYLPGAGQFFKLYSDLGMLPNDLFKLLVYPISKSS